MRGNPFIPIDRAAERAGYPALLFVTMGSLTIMVAAITLLAVTQAAWAFALSMLSLVVALALLAAGIDASFSESEDTESEDTVENGEVVAMGERGARKLPEPHRDAA